MCQTYPTLDMLTVTSTVRYPEELRAILKARYDEHGAEYATEEIDEPTGLPVNRCMVTSSWVEAEEELVDAIFNLSVALFRLRAQSAHSQTFNLARAELLLFSTIAAWSTCKDLQKEVPLE